MLLHYAAKWGDVETIRRLVGSGRSIDEREYDGSTPLLWAAESRHARSDVLLALIELGADVDAPNDFDRRPIDVASEPEKLRVLLSKGADIHAVAEDGSNALLRAPLDLERLRVLLDAGADPNATSSDGETTLERAVADGSAEIVELLLERGAVPFEDERFPLLYAIVVGSAEDVAAALGRGISPQCGDPFRADPWETALRVGDLDKVKALVEAGADPRARDPFGRSSLAIAASANRSEIVRWLLDFGVPFDEPDDFGNSALIDACGSGATDAVAILLEAGAASGGDERYGEAIEAAGGIDVVRLLVARGADVNRVDGEGYWLLKRAAENGDEAFARDLLALGADVDTTCLGDTALLKAVRFDEREVVRLLLAAGADPNAQDLDGHRPLHDVKSPEVARSLLAAGADPSVRNHIGDVPRAWIDEPEVLEVVRETGGSLCPTDADGCRALARAVDLGRLDLAKDHLSHGASVDSATPWGETALMAAAEKSDVAMVRLLLDAGAKVDLKDERGRTALHRAAAPEAFDVYRMMVEGPTPSESFKSLPEDVREFVEERIRSLRDAMGEAQTPRPTYGYVQSDSTEVLAMLVEAGASLHDEDMGNCTPLILAAALGRASRVRWLLERENDPEARAAQIEGAVEVLEERPDDDQKGTIAGIIASARG